MVAAQFMDYVSKLQIATYVGVEDFADKFNFLVTVMVLSLCSTIVTVKQYMMKPISCYMATDLGGKNLLDYVENYCWVQGTVPISLAGRIPETDDGWNTLEENKILYYQWVPFVLGLQCIMFYIPRLIWQMICYNRTGTDIQHLVLSANQAVHASDEQRTKMVQHIARTLEQLLFQREQYRALFRKRKGRPETNHLPTDPHSKGVPQPDMNGSIELKPQYDVDSRTVPEPRDDTIDYHRQAPSDAEKSHSLIGLVCSRLRRALCSNRFDRHRGTFLSVAYMFLKLLYLANAIGQLFLMQYFLGFQGGDATYGFGITVLQNIMNGHDWEATLVFPRVAYCYAPVKHLGTRTNTATAQCVLPVNMLNEKIYIFLWWWIVFVATLTAFSLFRWSIRMLSRTGPVDFVTKYLTLGEHYDPCDCELLQEFVRHFLRHDGVFLLKMLSYNAGELITSDVLALVWSAYREKQMSLTKPRHSVLPHSPDKESKEPGAQQSNVNVRPSAPRMPDLPQLPPPRPPNYPAHSMNGNLIPMGDTVSNRLPVLRPKPNSMSGTMV